MKTRRYLHDIKDDNLKSVISQLGGNEFGTDYKPNSSAPMFSDFLANHRRSNKGVNLKAEC